MITPPKGFPGNIDAVQHFDAPQKRAVNCSNIVSSS
jgi:hypothetical protein